MHLPWNTRFPFAWGLSRQLLNSKIIYLGWKSCDMFFYLQDGDIINIDVTVYLNVSCTFLGVAGCLFLLFCCGWEGTEARSYLIIHTQYYIVLLKLGPLSICVWILIHLAYFGTSMLHTLISVVLPIFICFAIASFKIYKICALIWWLNKWIWIIGLSWWHIDNFLLRRCWWWGQKTSSGTSLSSCQQWLWFGAFICSICPCTVL